MLDSLVVEEPFVPVETVLVLVEFEFKFEPNFGKLCDGILLGFPPAAPRASP